MAVELTQAGGTRHRALLCEHIRMMWRMEDEGSRKSSRSLWDLPAGALRKRWECFSLGKPSQDQCDRNFLPGLSFSDLGFSKGCNAKDGDGDGNQLLLEYSQRAKSTERLFVDQWRISIRSASVRRSRSCILKEQLAFGPTGGWVCVGLTDMMSRSMEHVTSQVI